MKGYDCAKLHALSFAFAFALVSAISILALGILGWVYGVGTEMINLSSTVYYGFAPTLVGSLIGAVWGFVDGFIFGYLIAFFYNLCCSKCLRCAPREGSVPSANVPRTKM